MAHHLLTLHDPAGHTLAEAVTPGATVLDSVHELTRTLNFGVTHPLTLVLFAVPNARVHSGDQVYDGAHTWTITDAPRTGSHLVGLT